MACQASAGGCGVMRRRAPIDDPRVRDALGVARYYGYATGFNVDQQRGLEFSSRPPEADPITFGTLSERDSR
jgi:hypothetical protein